MLQEALVKLSVMFVVLVLLAAAAVAGVFFADDLRGLLGGGSSGAKAAMKEQLPPGAKAGVTTLTIDARSYGSYPAATVSLDDRKVVKMEPSRRTREGALIEAGGTMHADLYVEPGGPEIKGLRDGDDDRRLAGSDVQVAPCEGTFEKPVVPTRINWRRKLKRHHLRTERPLFLVKSRSRRLYVVQVTALHSENIKRDKREASMTLRFRELQRVR